MQQPNLYIHTRLYLPLRKRPVSHAKQTIELLSKYFDMPHCLTCLREMCLATVFAIIVKIFRALF